jgi:hypothetical protein
MNSIRPPWSDVAAILACIVETTLDYFSSTLIMKYLHLCKPWVFDGEQLVVSRWD